ncbi:MAG: response regulator [Gemmatimonadota bacterium]
MLPHILLVEDNALVIGALRLLLEETGHRVSDASTVAAASRVLSTDRPDVVLLDLTLGSEDGLALFSSMDAAGEPRPIVVALTGHDDPATFERCASAGCRAVLVKPIRPLELKSQIAGWLGERAGLAETA